MFNKSRKIKFLSLVLAASGFVLASGNSGQVFAQRDPFAKTQVGAPKPANPTTGSSSSSSPRVPVEKPKPLAPMPLSAPRIEDRIAYYKRLREAAAMQNQPLPKVTSVLTLDEMSVTGIFRTPRGFAAMVEAKPIKLSYTIYPGEKFFDGQLVAIEENKLVFRRVTKWTNGKFVASEENKPLRQYTVDQEVQGTAPVEPSGKTETAASTGTPAATGSIPVPSKTDVPTMLVSSPLEEMNRQAAEPSKDSAKDSPADKNKKRKAGTSTVKKTVKVAKNKDQ